MNGLLAAEFEIRFTDFRLCEVKFSLFALHNFDGDITCIKGPDSAVLIAAQYGPDGLGISSRERQDFVCPSRTTQRPTHPHTKWVKCLSLG
jgi:hypothetical protein